MVDENIFKIPSEEEAVESLLSQPLKDIDWKACTLLVVGISQEAEKDNEYPILYSLARWNIDLNRFMPADLKAEYGSWTNFMMTKRHQTDETGGLVFEEDPDQPGYYDPVPLVQTPEGKKEYVQKMMGVPAEALEEEEHPSRVLDYEAPAVQQLIKQHRSPIVSWYSKGKALIYRQPTGKYYNPTIHKSRTVVIAQMVQLLRKALWMIKLPVPSVRHTPHAKISPEAVHQRLMEIVQKAKVNFIKRLTAANESFEEGFIDYKVAIIEPTGVEGIFSNIEEALYTVGEHYVQQLLQEEPMKIAAELSKDEVKALIKAADILDAKAPTVASLIDKVIASKQAEFPQEYDEFKREDLIAALTRVANNLDKDGAIKEAKLADKLLRSILANKKQRKTQM